ncbi:hypothetical protein BHE74_00052057 [Ensete ventricosum]|nr:hypothetical protein BHE74_00052057 [Ensete ventricosum]
MFSLRRPRLGCFLLHRLPGDIRMLVRRCLGQLRDVGYNGLDHPDQCSDLLGETEERLSRHDGRPKARRDGESPGFGGVSLGSLNNLQSRAEVSARLVLIRVHKSANVGGGQNFLRGLMLPRGSSTRGSVGLSLGPSRGWRSCTQASLEMGGVTQRGPSDAQVSENPEWPSRAGKVWGSREKRVRSREREHPFLPAIGVSALYLWEGSLLVHPALPSSSLGIWPRRTEDVRLQRHAAWARQCRVQAPPPQIPDRSPTWSLGLT